MISTKQVGLVCTLSFLAAVQLQASTALTFGTTYAGTISVPGQTNAFTFNGTPGQRLYFDSQDFDGVNLYATLLSPGGVNLYQGNDDADAGPWVLTEPGTHQLVINALSSLTTNFLFRLLDLATAPALTLGTPISDQLSPGLACNIYQFTGKPGQQIKLQTLSYSTNQATWALISPANVVLTGGGSKLPIDQNLGTVTLPISGQYCLLISGNAATTTPLTFQVLLSDVSDSPVVSSGFGTAHSGTISANQTNSFNYNASAGLPVYFDSLDFSGQSLVVDLIDPSGASVFSMPEVADAGPYVLPRSGTYTLRVRGPNGSSGNYNFRLLDLSTSPALPLNSPVTNILTLAYQTDVYQLNGAAGQRLYYDSLTNLVGSMPLQLLAPDGQALISGNLYADWGPVVLPYSGTYYLFLQSTLATAPGYQFQMIDISTQPALPLNQDLAGILVANSSLIYQLNGTAGQKLYFQGEMAEGGAYWTLYNSKNQANYSANLYGDFETSLPYTAAYTLVIRGATFTFPYSNRVSTFSYSTNILSLGTSITNNIVNPGDQVFYTFTGTAGQMVYYDGIIPYFPSISVAVLTPSGTSLLSVNASSDFSVILPQSGTYLLAFDGNVHTTGPIGFQLLDISAQPELPLNADLTGNLAPYVSQAYQLAGTAGQRLYFNSKAVSAGGATWTLFGPNNAYINSAVLASDFEQILPNSGTYFLLLGNGPNPVSYSNQVNTFAYTTNSLTLGTPVTNNLVEPGDQIFYTFTGTPGQRVYLDSSLANYSSVNWTIYSPSGAQLATGSTTYDLGPITLPQAGTYTIQIDGTGDAIGPVSFNLLDVGAQPALPLNTDLVGTLAPNNSSVYTLAGVAGQRLFFNSKGGSGNGGSWTLYGPNNANVNSANLPQDFEQTLANTGQYVLVFSAGSNPITYSNQVNTFGYSTNALTLNTVVNTSVVHPGDQFYYTFSGTAGQRLYYDSRQTNNNTSITATLIAPAGSYVFSGNSGSDAGPFTLSQSGTYTLLLDGSGDSTGNVSFNLFDLASAAPVTVGNTISDSLADQTETRLYRFSGSVGQRLNLQSLTPPSNQALWGLFSLNDQLIGGVFISGNIGIVTLPATGTYTVAVIGYGVLTSPVSYQLSLTDVSDSPVASSGFGIVHSGTIAPGQTNTFTYTGSAGLPVFFDSQDTSGTGLVVDLVSSDNTAVLSGVSETADYAPVTLPRSGTYTLTVRGAGNAGGNYSFRLLDMSASSTLQLNTPVTGVLSNPYQTEIYKLDGPAGLTLYYDALTNDVNYPSVYMQFLDPRGQTVGVNANFDTDRGPFTVQYGGTSYLLARNNRNVASAYSFQMLDVSAQPVLPINTAVSTNLDVYPVKVYRYAGSAGQKLYFHGQSANPSGFWIFYDPNNASQGSGGLSGDFEVTLAYTGAYALVLSSYATTSGTESFQVHDFSYITNAYTIGTRVVDAIARPGERRAYTFTGTLGQQLVYSALTNSAGSPNIIGLQLFNPQGGLEAIGGGDFANYRAPLTLQQSGTYTLLFDGSGSTVGPFAFELLDVAAQPVLPVNAPVSISLDAYGDQVYRYAGTAGQRLYFRGQSTNPYGFWTLYDANNNQVSAGSSSLTGDFEVTLPITGAYSLVLGSYGTVGTEQFQINDFAYITNAYTVGTTIVDAIQRAGEQRTYTFSGTINQRLLYDSLTNDLSQPNSINVTLLNPQGVAEPFLGGRFGNDQGPFTLEQTGTYTLIFDGTGSSTGPFAFRLLDLSLQPLLPIGIGQTNTLDPYAQQVYRYAGTNGQHLYFRGSPANTSGFWKLIDPNNNQVTGGNTSLAADFQVTLPLTGDYGLLLGNYNTAAATEIFQVNPFNNGETLIVNRAPVLNHIGPQVLAAGVVVSFTAQATDADNNSLTFSLDSGSPAGASINPLTGAFTWNPPVTGLSSVTPVTVRVTDNGTPSLSAAETLPIEVIAGPTMITVQKIGAVANVYYHSAPTKHYRLQYKNELSDPNWQAVGSDLTATSLITIQPDATIGSNTHRFYRVQALDPLP
jgi:hypothetical protein